jgi:tripartite-type tricarboxylate transporter receptor subunit TctC
METRRQFVCVGVAATASLTATGWAQGLADFPNRAVTIIGTHQAGGGQDSIARVVAQKLSDKWRQPVVVEPRPGANGMIAASTVARAKADGHILLISTPGVIQNPLLYKKPLYRTEELVGVSQVALFPNALAVRADLGINSVADLVAEAKKRPGKLSLGSNGVASSGHLLGEALKRECGIFMLHVPYSGEAGMIAALLAGQIDGGISSIGGLGRHASAGKLKLLAVANDRRHADFPEVPTFEQAGLPAVNVPGWTGLFAPSATPAAIVEKIASDVHEVLQLPDVVSRAGALGATPLGSNPAAFAKALKTEQALWEATIRRAHISVE